MVKVPLLLEMRVVVHVETKLFIFSTELPPFLPPPQNIIHQGSLVSSEDAGSQCLYLSGRRDLRMHRNNL